MVGILTKDHDLDLIHRSQLEGLEYLGAGREYDLPLRLLFMEITRKRGKVGFPELTLQRCLPTLFYPYVHKMSSLMAPLR